MSLGPRALGHDPLVLPEQREKALRAVENSGAIDFPDEPLLPFLPDNPRN